MNRLISFIITFVILVGIYFAADAILLYHHESAHQAIYSSYNITSYTSYSLIDGGKTYSYESCPENTDCNSLHDWNEIIGYHTAAFLENIWCMIIFCIVYIEWRGWRNEKNKDKRNIFKERRHQNPMQKGEDK